MSQVKNQCPTMTVAEAAEALGLDEKRFRRNRLKWERQHGMPLRLPAGTYSRANFMHWVDTYSAMARRQQETRAELSSLTVSRKHLELVLGVAA